MKELKNNIITIENQIQDLRINLGQYDEENEFCTIDYTLIENIYKGRKIGIFQRLIVTL